MNIFLRRFLLILFLLTTGCGRSMTVKREADSKDPNGISKAGAILYVTSTDGLFLRSAPDASAKKVALIPFAEKVSILSVDGIAVSVGGRTGNWAKVAWREKTGYVFDYFLTDELSQLLAHKRFVFGNGCTGLEYSEHTWHLIFLPAFKYRSERISGWGTSCNRERIAEGSYDVFGGKLTLRATSLSDRIVGGKGCEKMNLPSGLKEIIPGHDEGIFVVTQCEKKLAIAASYDSPKMLILTNNPP
ncbi:hypothetical protein Turpa_3420 [Turneriella parva DSM 21527]|uniref:SH3b domain-containing protein n=2 Tax=Turneriella parva (strain ATCC BAA-1111 / DSM 21527 / NCTC 11395 / H) TaxID=869212 RepID=I4B9V0_TURPD|nr:hypothetical protein Turpa_3420 [Turneriella parva DSM 21527]